ncbi:hypothetical protein [Nocardioides sp. SYSU D00038]|uniref:hypothetical protein n=1 Tax=Nocardioides sp. SYSU D00038 TaxID=2812554 RepID=UPI0019685FD2|nr:hypothetical protein [Nocardioides sp. SYSU D00038]
MSLSRRALGALLSLFLAGTGLLLLPSAPAVAADPMAGAPAEGSCYRLTVKAGWESSYAHNAVQCSGRHTSRVYAVGLVPDGVSLVDDSPALFAAVGRTCDPDHWRLAGKDPRKYYLSLYSSWWFVPDAGQRAAGARWISCHVALDAGSRLLPLPKGPLPKLKKGKRVPDKVARCTTGSGKFTACNKPHAYRSVHAFVTKARGSDSKVERLLRKAAIRKCSPKVSSRTFRWSYRPLARNRFVIACFTKTSR